MDDVLNLESLSDLAFLGRERFCELVESYAQSAAKQLAVIGEGLVQGDCDAARLGAHTLRGTSLIFGAHRVAECATELEDAATAGRTEDCHIHHQALRRAVETAVARLRTLAVEDIGS